MEVATELTQGAQKARAPAPPAPERPLRVCLLGYRSNPYSGGQGVYLRYLSAALADAGHRVDVISGQPYPELDDRVRLIPMPGMNLFEADNRLTALRARDLRSATNLYEWLSMLTGGFPEPCTFGRRVVRYLARHGHEYDLVHDNQSLCYGLLTLQRMGLPTVATIHHPITSDRAIALANAADWRHRLLIRRWYSFVRMQRRVVRQLRHVITVSECSRHDIARAFGIRARSVGLVYNGIDTQTFRPLDGVQRRPRRIMATASADVPLKGLDYLLHAAASLRNSYPDLEVVVLGRPRENGHTAKLVRRLGLEATVRFISGVGVERIVREYAEATVAVVPSLYEGFGLPAGEAMACGLPVISTTGGALPEVVGDAGILVPPADSGAIARAASDLFENPARRLELAQQARQRIVERFSWRVAARQMVDYYRHVLGDADD
ncbi:MAG TPA: glycosyltransferase family 4 protein [Gammaproteobacteria bacterium]|nr:glycosyltransferase family 4 protein [Gammaproteobacteria bacterium]